MPARAEKWWLYVLECRRGVLYTGIAKDVKARFAAHLSGKGAKFTRANRPVAILAKASLRSRGQALRAEYALKQLPRADKLRWCAAGLRAFAAKAASPGWKTAGSRPPRTSPAR
jgi:predicted GIY-YIG superfamily endonuclease